MVYCSRAKGSTVITLTCVYSCWNITQNLKIILTSDKSFSSVNACTKGVCLYTILSFFSDLYILAYSIYINFLKKILQICKATKKDTCQKFAFNTFFLVGVNFWAIIQAAVQVKIVQACCFCATCTPWLQWRKGSLQIIKHLAVPSSCIRL